MFLNNQSTTLMLGTRPGPFTGFGNIADPMSATKEGDEGGELLAVSAVDDFSRFCQACSPLPCPPSLAIPSAICRYSLVGVLYLSCVSIYLALHIQCVCTCVWASYCQ